jgi:hypothetical protein
MLAHSGTLTAPEGGTSDTFTPICIFAAALHYLLYAFSCVRAPPVLIVFRPSSDHSLVR